MPDVPQKGHSQNLSNAGNFAGALNTDNLTDRPEMTFFKIWFSLRGLVNIKIGVEEKYGESDK